MLTEIKTTCYHCGDDCPDNPVVLGDKTFCCAGCKAVFEILSENNLCTYYQLETKPGNKTGSVAGKNRFAYLDEQSIADKLLSFKDEQSAYITLYIPQIHCSSCIWLLENLHKINKGVISSHVEFMKKEIEIIYNHHETSLRKIVEQLTMVGYEPSLTLYSTSEKTKNTPDRKRIYRIGIAGFCFGNIMMLSFPEYLSGGAITEPGLKVFFTYLNLLLALPVFFFSSGEFFSNAWNGFKQKAISIDLPISIGIIAMFVRSSYEILSHTGPGFLDSMSGLVFFMLIGRKFQEYTFDSLAFDRDYKSYFPVAVDAIKDGIEKPVIVNDLKINDTFIIRSNEIIPVDAILIKGTAKIDYSFVTGESAPVILHPGAAIFSGGKHTGGIIELLVVKELSQSRLTHLWNKNHFKKAESTFQKAVKIISRWFIAITLLIATAAAFYWIQTDMRKAMNAFTAALVIACPCALALSAPFTFGNILRLLGKRKIYIKAGEAIEKLADVDTIVFDKTGTLTESYRSNISFSGNPLSQKEKQLIFSLTRQSAHPLSQQICRLINEQPLEVTDFSETPGKGISGVIEHVKVVLGNSVFVSDASNTTLPKVPGVFIAIDGINKGTFEFKNTLRDGSADLINELLRKKYRLVVLTGDGITDKLLLENLFGSHADLLYNQSPKNKLDHIKKLQQEGHKVLMIGDGLNDAGALLQSDAGISISDNANNFTPASDAIMDASQLKYIGRLLSYSKAAMRIITWSFILSLLYNFIGLSYAVSGTLSPVIAAVLMPVSTISLVLFTVILSTLRGKYLFRSKKHKIHEYDINHIKQ